MTYHVSVVMLSAFPFWEWIRHSIWESSVLLQLCIDTCCYITLTRQSPLHRSPILVHQRKQFHSYNYFSSTLNGLNQKLTSVKPIGTDGEKKIVNVTICYFSQYNAPGTFSKTLNSIFVKSSPPPPPSHC